MPTMVPMDMVAMDTVAMDMPQSSMDIMAMLPTDMATMDTAMDFTINLLNCAPVSSLLSHDFSLSLLKLLGDNLLPLNSLLPCDTKAAAP